MRKSTICLAAAVSLLAGSAALAQSEAVRSDRPSRLSDWVPETGGQQTGRQQTSEALDRESRMEQRRAMQQRRSEEMSADAAERQTLERRRADASLQGYPNVDRDVVAQVQRQLNQRGFNLTVDGVPGTDTRNALMVYQANTGLRPTGLIDLGTIANLGIDVNVARVAPQSAADPTVQDWQSPSFE